MIVKLLLTFLILNLQANESVLVDQELKGYYNSFYQECFKYKNKCKTSSLKFDPFMQYKFQLSGFGDRKTNTAWINKSAFFGSSNVYKEMLIYHELAHVSLTRDHCDSESSLMNKYLISESFYIANKQMLIKELFKGKCK